MLALQEQHKGPGGTSHPVQAQDLFGSATSQHAPVQGTAQEIGHSYK